MFHFQTWDTTLATLAGYNARDCVFKHDDCRNTHAYKNAGQNIALEEQSDQYMENTAAIQKSIDEWFNEYTKCPPSVIESYQTGTSVYGHFTQIVQDKSDRIGCAGVRYFQNGWYNTYIVCDYSATNLLGQPVYATGQQCSKCTGKCGSNYPGLCTSSNEVSDNTNAPTGDQSTAAQPESSVTQPDGAVTVDTGVAPTVTDPTVVSTGNPDSTSMSDQSNDQQLQSD